MGRMTWDLATLEYRRWAGRAAGGWEADSDSVVDKIGGMRKKRAVQH
jgi:hypothetical protein